MSALKDQGVVEWLDIVSGIANGGHKIIDVDYDTYAKGEAELGWLNASISLVAREATGWDAFARSVIGLIHCDPAGSRAEIGHLKLLISNPSGQVVVNVTLTGEMPDTRGNIGTLAGTALLIVNVRVGMEPQELKSIVERSITAAAGRGIEISELSLNSFRPAYPRPTYRMDRVVVQP